MTLNEYSRRMFMLDRDYFIDMNSLVYFESYSINGPLMSSGLGVVIKIEIDDNDDDNAPHRGYEVWDLVVKNSFYVTVCNNSYPDDVIIAINEVEQ